MRTFIALELPNDFASDVAKIEAQLAPSMNARFTPEQSLHLTLAFLGNLETSSQVAATRKAIELATSNFAPVSLHPEGLGYFGSPADATVWLGVSPTPALMNLAKSVKAELSVKGLPFDQTPFKPHITLARKAHIEHADFKSCKLPDTAHATKVTIFKSELNSQGAHYTPLHSVVL